MLADLLFLLIDLIVTTIVTVWDFATQTLETPVEVGAALTSITFYLYKANSFLPVSTFIAVFIVISSIEAALLFLKVGGYVIKKAYQLKALISPYG